MMYTFLFKASNDNKVLAGKVGAIEAIIKAMKAHILDDVVCDYGCTAIWSITDNNCRNG